MALYGQCMSVKSERGGPGNPAAEERGNSTGCSAGTATSTDSYELCAGWQFTSMVWRFSAPAAH